MKLHVLISYVLFIFLMKISPAVADTPLHIAVASNFKQVQEALSNLFETQYLLSNPDSRLEIINSSGSSGTLFAQIKNGAPYDIFLSADEVRPDTLIELGLAQKKNRTVYAQGQIVLWQPASNDAFDINVYKSFSGSHALANPKLAPYGAASRTLMEKYGFWKKGDRSRILAHNIATAFQYAASGSVKLAWVSYSQLKTWEQQEKVPKNSYWLPPVNDYPAIYQVGVQLKNAKNQALADQYLQFLSAPKAKNLIKSFGYLIPKQ